MSTQLFLAGFLNSFLFWDIVDSNFKILLSLNLLLDLNNYLLFHSTVGEIDTNLAKYLNVFLFHFF